MQKVSFGGYKVVFGVHCTLAKAKNRQRQISLNLTTADFQYPPA
jgi:hypothetical protein